MYTNEERKQIANTILSQLGGNQFIAMTGAKQFLSLESGLQFGVGRGAKSGINKVRVILNACDLYDVEFWKCGKFDFKCVKSLEGVYAEDLRRIFTENTGFYCTLR